MFEALRGVYAALRRVPVAGAAVSRLVWMVKGALGLAVRRPSPASSHPTDGMTAQAGDASAAVRLQTQLDIVFAALDGLARDRGATAPHSTREVGLVEAAPRVSVIVNTYDRAPYLRQTLLALDQLRYPAFELIVVDGPSSDDTQAVLAAASPYLRLAQCPAANLAQSRNIGLAHARGEIVAFIDDDAIPEPDWLDQLVAAYGDARVAGVGGFIRDRSGVAYQCRVVVADRYGTSRSFESLGAASLEPHAPGVERFLSLTGANCAFRRDALMAIGGFDETYSYFLEETDACLRLVDRGWDLAAAPDAEVHHRYAESPVRRADETPKSLLATVRSSAYFAMRHGAVAHGVKATAEQLCAYVEALQASVAWRHSTGLIQADHQARLMHDIAQGLQAGVASAFAAPTPHTAIDPPGTAQAFRRYVPKRESCDRLRLCLLSQQYPPGPVGGIANWTRALAEGLSQAGHEVTVMTRADEAQVQYRDGVWVHGVASVPSEASTSASDSPRDRPTRDRPAHDWTSDLPPSILSYSRALAAEVERVRPRRRFDLVMGPLWDLEPAAILALGAAPTVVSLHTAYAQAEPFKPAWRSDAAFRTSHLARVIAGERFMLAHAPVLLANSTAVVDDLAQAYDIPGLARRCTVIAHGLPDRARRLPLPAHDAEREDEVEILFVGRLERRKGIDVLLDAAIEVLKAAPRVRFVIVGQDGIDDPHDTVRAGFERRCRGADPRPRIRFEGALSAEALIDRYAACDLFVAPSRYESFGLVFVEAMMFAKPCIGCRVGGVGEVVADGETGFLVAPGDAMALARAILELVANPDRRRAMGQAGRRRYEARFTAEAMVGGIQALFEQVIRATPVREPGLRSAASTG